MKLTPAQNKMLNEVRASGSQGLFVDGSNGHATRVGNALLRLRLVTRIKVEGGWRYINR